MILNSPSLNFLFPSINTPPSWLAGQCASDLPRLHALVCNPSPHPWPPPPNKSFLVTKHHYFSVNTTKIAKLHNLWSKAQMVLLICTAFRECSITSLKTSNLSFTFTASEGLAPRLVCKRRKRHNYKVWSGQSGGGSCCPQQGTHFLSSAQQL